MTDKPIRVLLADDHAVLRAGLRALLSAEPDMEVVGEAGDGQETVRQAALLRPDVVVMDIAMPGGGGLQATRAFRERVMEKLNLHHRSELVKYALRKGLLQADAVGGEASN